MTMFSKLRTKMARRRLAKRWPRVHRSHPELLLDTGRVLSARAVMGVADLLDITDIDVASALKAWNQILDAVALPGNTINADMWNAVVDYAIQRSDVAE